MKFKHVLFSSLLVSTAFVACTNEDFEVNGIQNVTKDAISLGENFTISGGFQSETSTKAIYEESLDGSKVAVKSMWEPNDEIGGAWYAAQMKAPTATTAAVGYPIEMGGTKVFASNHPFTRVNKEGNVETAEFQTNTNVFAGKYMLYFPYDDEVSDVSEAIPVEMPVAQEMDVTNPLAHINANTFFYTNQTYEVGGTQAGEFEMKPVPVLYRLTFSAAEGARGVVGQDISMIVVESNDKLFSDGQITVSGTAYANAVAKYEGKTAASVYTLTLSGNEGNADYQISAVGENGGMKKPVYLAMLPAKSDISALTFKVVTADGKVYTKTIDNLGNSDMASYKEEITSEGGLFANNIELDEVAEATGEIYTEQQFMNSWEAALKTGAGTITLGAPLELDELTLGTQGVNIEVTGDYELYVKNLTVNDGELNVNELKADNINVGVYGVLETTAVSVSEKVSVSGNATLAGVKALKDVAVARKGILSLTGVSGKKVTGSFTSEVESVITLSTIELAGTNSLNGTITTATATVTFSGATTIAKEATLTTKAATTFKALTINGELKSGSAGITLNGAAMNNGTITKGSGTITISKDGSLTNKGTLGGITNEGVLTLEKTTKSEIINSKILNVKAGDDPDADPATTADLSIINTGTVNFEMSNNETEVTVASLNNNTGLVNINKGIVKEKADGNINGDGDFYIAADGKLKFEAKSSAHNLGYIIITKVLADAVTNNHTNDRIACYYSDLSKVTATEIATVIFDAAANVSATDCATIQKKNLIIRADLVLGGNITMAASTTISVEKEVLLTSKKEGGITISANSTATITTELNAVLKIGSGVKLKETNFTTDNAAIVAVGGTIE